ncbi:DNA-binding GntR family transcriptional regulator [Pullulanibacillus pueri]|uniref:GntR family transcriptional regulator n=1 Tax=Pullulanibacillus pueri TaxID=1437324 RepID=A0A8J2ZU34_9BACL|nr:GntR family transcriptional regulator [Pullulanibacillus pueri]MBM7681806.1 DNA-binding GntR family transcriptional regulator [Pullulanibacillus pueri]GGH76160.1 GntR family transcriptional regulator [Pullulanibacillus pueri]
MEGNQPLIQHNSISTQVYLSLKKAIIEGKLPPGERLIVLEIADRFEISQAPVREALERLKQEELIIGKRNKGSVVSNISSKEIKDIFVLREMIEGFAVRETHPQLKEADYRYLENTIMEMGEAIKQNEMLKILEHDMAFHGFFYERCHNDAVLDLWNRMKIKVMRFMAISNKLRSTDGLVRGHLDLIKVLKTGDLEIIEEKFVDHMKSYKFIHLDE